jgi:hypothetical protein
MSGQSPDTTITEKRKSAYTLNGNTTTIGGFRGRLEKGPLTATLVTSPEDKKELFGDTPIGDSPMEDVLEDFWNNGGGACYLSRVLGAGYLASSLALKSTVDGATSGYAESGLSTATVALADGDNIIPKIDGSTKAAVVIHAKRAYVVGGAAAWTTPVDDGDTLVLDIQGVQQTIVFNNVDNSELAFLATINSQLTGARAFDDGTGKLKILCDVAGSSSSGEVVSGSAKVLTTLGLSVVAFSSGGFSNVADASKVTWAELGSLLATSVGLSANVTVSATKVRVTTATSGTLGSVQFASGSIVAKIGADTDVHYGLGSTPVLTLTVTASSPGAWANKYQVAATRVDTKVTKLALSYAAGTVLLAITVASVSRIRVGDTLSFNNGTVRGVVKQIDGNLVTFVASVTVPLMGLGWDTTTDVTSETFSLTTYDKDGALVPSGTFADLRMSSLAGELYVANRVNNTSRCPITVTVASSAALDPRPLTTAATYLAGGSDGAEPVAADYVGDKASKTGLWTFNKAADVNMISIPGCYLDVDIVKGMELYGEDRRDQDVEMIYDAPPSMDEAALKTWVTETANIATSHGSLFAPHGYKRDKVTGGLKLVPPCGVVQGVTARTHNNLNIGAAAAGKTEGKINGWLGLQYEFTQEEYDVVYKHGVNFILNTPGEGIAVWGCVTLDPVGEYRLRTKRTIFNAAKRKIRELSRDVAFKGNNPTTRGTVVRNLTAVFREWRQAEPPILSGAVDDEAFFIVCDETNNGPFVTNAGRFVCRIGLADSKPAEFQEYSLETDTRALDAALASTT